MCDLMRQIGLKDVIGNINMIYKTQCWKANK